MRALALRIKRIIKEEFPGIKVYVSTGECTNTYKEKVRFLKVKTSSSDCFNQLYEFCKHIYLRHDFKGISVKHTEYDNKIIDFSILLLK